MHKSISSFAFAVSMLAANAAVAAPDFPVGTWVCSFQANGAATQTIRVTAVTIGGIEMPFVDAKAIEGEQSTEGGLRGLATLTETRFGKFLAVAGTSNNFWMSFEKPEEPVLQWKNRYRCRAK